MELIDKKELISLMAHMRVVRENIDTVAGIKRAIESEDYHEAILLSSELSNDDITTLWRATSKGGIWTTKERAIMKSDEWARIRRSL